MINRSESRLIAKELRNQANRTRKSSRSKPKREPARSASPSRTRSAH